jgi:hypothetical protein
LTTVTLRVVLAPEDPVGERDLADFTRDAGAQPLRGSQEALGERQQVTPERQSTASPRVAAFAIQRAGIFSF